MYFRVLRIKNGDKALDITTQVVAGLNKAYKKTDLSKASSKDEKKK